MLSLSHLFKELGVLVHPLEFSEGPDGITARLGHIHIVAAELSFSWNPGSPIGSSIVVFSVFSWERSLMI